ncbi:ABC transporter ATP-binding protein [Alkalitalea saponilacus]|uniref:Putative ABC transport system ATP-binding protein n=1 Tax=Alkalitalea saponilacus TaxID=889453 RepID=A0A1T5GMZ8_9BACT|nr:ATP-binding cassette domain-containing protein [Alkalitalea saponilacus]ASB48258.1 ABC transporter ATP-binding protein [Alkalitalea saponilacus]SKC09779.1 putative ABC transport system ATP-binding protein [Alkalitalea saponilacus]
MIITKELKFTYPGTATLSFKDFSLTAGQQILIKGESGSGKTTLLHLLSGILTPDSGIIEVDEVRVDQLRAHQRDSFRANHIGLIFQRNLFIKSISMYKNMLLAQHIAQSKEDREILMEILEELGISNLSGKKPHHLSQGEQQRFSIARALVNNPKVVLADEPTSSLDDVNCHRFSQMLKSICEKYNITLLIATHDSRLEQQFNCVIELNESK